MYYDRGQVRPGTRFEAGAGFGMQALFDWYFGTELGGVGKTIGVDLTLAMHTTARVREAFAKGAMLRERARCSNRGVSAMAAGSS